MANLDNPPVSHSFAETVSEKHMPMLDGFRAVAAFSVVVSHFYGITFLDGVTAFFVLSGFLITTLLLRERRANGSVSLSAFFARRTLRIFPAYYACVAASYVIDSVAGNPWPNGLLAAALVYVVNYFNAFNGHPSTSIAHLWSLGVEEQFYILWPLSFLLLARLGSAAIRRGLVLMILAGFAWRSTLYFGGFVGQAYLYNAFDARFDNLAVGCLLAVVATSPRMGRVAAFVGAYSWMPVVTLGLMALISIALPSSWRHLVGFTLYSFLVATLLVQLLQLRDSAMWRWLDWAPVRFLGTISYPIYLYHAWGLGLGHWLTTMPTIVQFAAGVIFTVVGAAGSYFIIERPFLTLKKRFASIRRPALAPVAP